MKYHRCPGGESVEQMEARVDSVIDKVRRINDLEPYFFSNYDTRCAITTKNTKTRGRIQEMFLSWLMGISVVSSSHVGSNFPFVSVRDILLECISTLKRYLTGTHFNVEPGSVCALSHPR